jgi:hypothetical protein
VVAAEHDRHATPGEHARDLVGEHLADFGNFVQVL